LATVAELVVRVGINNRDLERGLADSTRRAAAFGDLLSAIGSRLTTTVTLPFVGLAAASVAAATRLDSLKRGLEAVAGSSQEAERQLARLTEIAKAPGIGFAEAIQGSVRLQSVGFSAGLAERSLKAFANAIALTGGGRAELQRVTVQLGQLASKGKVLSQDLRPIIENAPAVGRALREAFGTVDSEAIQALGLSTEQFMSRLLGALESLPQVTGGAKNAFENFRDAGERALGGMAAIFLPMLSNALNALSERVAHVTAAFRALSPSSQQFLVQIGLIAATIGPLLLVLGSAVRGLIGIGSAAIAAQAGLVSMALTTRLALIPSIRSAADAAYVLGISMRTLSALLVGGAIVGALAAIGYAFYRAGQKAREAAAQAKQAADDFRASLGIMSDTALRANILPLSEQVQVITGTVRSLREQLRAAGGELSNVDRARISVAGAQPGGLGAAMTRRLELQKELNQAVAREATLREQLRGVLDESNRRTIAASPTFSDLGAAPAPAAETEGARQARARIDLLTEHLRLLAEAFRLRRLDNQALQKAVDLSAQLSREQLESVNARLQETNDLARAQEEIFEGLAERQREIADAAAEELQTRIRISRLPAPPLLTRPSVPTSAPRTPTPGYSSPSGSAMAAPTTGLGRAMVDVLGAEFTNGVRRMFSSVGQHLGGIFRDMGSALMAAFGPAAVLMPVFNAMLERLTPAFNALLVPLLDVAAVFAEGLIPIFRALFPVFKALAIAATYAAQNILNFTSFWADLFGFIAQGWGHLIRAIGKAIDALPGISGGPIIRAGESILRFGEGLHDAADSMRESAEELSEARKRIAEMEFEDAERLNDASRAYSQAMLNVPQGFKLALARFNAILREGEVGTGPRTPPLVTPPVPPVVVSTPTNVPGGAGGGGTGEGAFQPALTISGGVTINVNTSGDGTETMANFREAARREAAGRPSMLPFLQMIGAV